MRCVSLLALVVVGACSNGGDEPMIILGNTAQMTGATACMYTGDPSQPITASGTISVASQMGYQVAPLIQSRITSPMGEELTRTIEVQGATVELSIPNGSTSISLDSNEAAFQAFFAVAVPPQGTANVQFELIPETVIAKVAKLGALGDAMNPVSVEVVAEVTLFGEFGGSRVTGQTWQYPVTICNDCVVSLDGVAPSYFCPLTITTIRTGDPCNPYQDGAVDCCVDMASNMLECPGPTM
ncbi:MAG TPA: hypothetical protein VMJ10_35740 [Kofleriaceae bacterium]|nr:hypothetical protein [Kofleriaceae bacterium]